MTCMTDFQTSLVNIKRHIKVMEKLSSNSLVTVPLIGRMPFYDFVGTDVYQILRCTMADALIWATEQAIDLAETLCLDDLHYALDYKFLISTRDWAIEESAYWYEDNLSHADLILELEGWYIELPRLSKALSDIAEIRRELDVREVYNAMEL